MTRFVVTVVLGVALAAGAAWYFDLWTPPGLADERPVTGPRSEETALVVIGKLLYPPAPEAPEDPAPQRQGADPIVLPDFTFNVKDKQDVPTQREGQLLFIG